MSGLNFHPCLRLNVEFKFVNFDINGKAIATLGMVLNTNIVHDEFRQYEYMQTVTAVVVAVRVSNSS